MYINETTKLTTMLVGLFAIAFICEDGEQREVLFVNSDIEGVRLDGSNTYSAIANSEKSRFPSGSFSYDTPDGVVALNIFRESNGLYAATFDTKSQDLVRCHESHTIRN